MGGTFDPVHVGHLSPRRSARPARRLDRVLLVVAGDPWQKHGQVVAGRRALRDGRRGGRRRRRARGSRIELDRAGPTYTIDTVEELAAPGPGAVPDRRRRRGAGSTPWQRADDLRGAVTLAVVARATTRHRRRSPAGMSGRSRCRGSTCRPPRCAIASPGRTRRLPRPAGRDPRHPGTPSLHSGRRRPGERS